jgi:hypothetical protein
VFTFEWVTASGPAAAIVTAYRDNALRRGSVPIAVYKKFTYLACQNTYPAAALSSVIGIGPDDWALPFPHAIGATC